MFSREQLHIALASLQAKNCPIILIKKSVKNIIKNKKKRRTPDCWTLNEKKENIYGKSLIFICHTRTVSTFVGALINMFLP